MELPENGAGAWRLKRWLSRPVPWMARVEYLTEATRENVVRWLGSEAEFFDARLPEQMSGADVADWMIARLSEAKPTAIVSFHGFGHAFREPVKDALVALNFQREAYKETGRKQIWWMSPEFLGPFVRGAPDLDSWFEIKLTIRDVPPPPELPVARARGSPPPGTAELEWAPALLRRAERAMRAGEPWTAVWPDWVVPALRSIRETRGPAAARAEAVRFGELIEEGLALAEPPVEPAAAREHARKAELVAGLLEFHGEFDEAPRIRREDELPAL